jgi:SH3 domain-containing YSC84-like protein 1
MRTSPVRSQPDRAATIEVDAFLQTCYEKAWPGRLVRSVGMPHALMWPSLVSQRMESDAMTKAPALLVATLAIAGFLLQTPPARAGDEANVMADATRTLEQLAADPSSGVPRELLRQSEGVVLIPNMINGGLVLGAKYGRGVFLVRDTKGRWGNPVLVTLWGGTLGLQAGGQATELLMVFRTKDTAARLLAGRGKVTLGVDAGVAAGPTGTKLGAETDIEFRAEILSYARSRGLFAGAALGGAGIRVDRTANSFFYDNFAATTFQIIEGDTTVNIPAQAAKLKATLAALTDPPSDEDAPVDGKVARSSRVRRSADADDPDAMPSGRASTRRRRATADDDDDAPAPRQARAPVRRKPPVDPDDPDDAPGRPIAKKPRPTNPDDDPDDLPPPPTKRKPARPPANPDDAPVPPGV